MIQHVYPLNDIRPHRFGCHAYCECDPQLIWTQDDQLIIVHRAFDWRDFYEQLEGYQRIAMNNVLTAGSWTGYKGLERLIESIGEKDMEKYFSPPWMDQP